MFWNVPIGAGFLFLYILAKFWNHKMLRPYLSLSCVHLRIRQFCKDFWLFFSAGGIRTNVCLLLVLLVFVSQLSAKEGHMWPLHSLNSASYICDLVNLFEIDNVFSNLKQEIL